LSGRVIVQKPALQLLIGLYSCQHLLFGFAAVSRTKRKEDANDEDGCYSAKEELQK
jgi:hypothetical protein